jgi:tartrate dehydratase beta subunit/fumarate hydratase class I family protein
MGIAMSRNGSTRSFQGSLFSISLTLALAATAGLGAAEPRPTDDAPPARLRVADEVPAVQALELLLRDVAFNLNERGCKAEFARWQQYTAKLLDDSRSGSRTELTGNCRLAWYDALLRDVLKTPLETEAFSRTLHEAVLDEQEGVNRSLALIREKLDLPAVEMEKAVAPASPEAALQALRTALTEARTARDAAFKPLSKEEVRELAVGLVPVMLGSNDGGHTLSDRASGRRLCDLLEKMDRGEMVHAAQILARLTDRRLLEQLANLPAQQTERVAGVTGTVVRKIQTAEGVILVGGRGPNTYQLDAMNDVVAVIDLGGDDTYLEGTVSDARPLLVLIDLAGNDTYRATKAGVQGSAVLGVSLLVDVAGNDLYEAKDLAQGAGLGGVGILVDFDGRDQYLGLRRVQGQAIGGVGILIDCRGKDRYHAAMWAQGFGGPLGFGLLDDCEGDDTYYAGGLYLDSYPETPGYEGWAQGVGAGLRQVANGGIGVLLDGAGDDTYQFDYMAHGGGYWLGVGIARDFSGNDRHLGSTETSYSGGRRGEVPFQRFGSGFGCHYGLGFLFDDSGDDTYRGTIMGMGFAWDCAFGLLADFSGNDRYVTDSNGSQGIGAQAGVGILYDREGDDQYVGTGQGLASPSVTYHPLAACGGNFSFLIDHGGEDRYGCGVQNNALHQRGGRSGFLVDRPSRTSSVGRNPSAVRQ